MHGHEPSDDGTDADLVARAAGGDRDAFAALYSRYQAPVYRFAVHMTGSPAAAEDIVQEVFVALMESLGRYDSGRPLAAYLYGISRNVTRRRLHRERRLVPLEEAHEHPVVVPFGERLERRQSLCLLRRAIVALPPVADLDALAAADANLTAPPSVGARVMAEWDERCWPWSWSG